MQTFRIVTLSVALTVLAAAATTASAQAVRSDRHVIRHTTKRIHHLNHKLHHQLRHHNVLGALRTQAQIGQAKVRRAYHKEDLSHRHH